MTDAEWAVLRSCLRQGGRGRPSRDARRIWDGIFWIACSRAPWRDLPEQFGKPDTAHRALRRAAAAWHLHEMLIAVSPHRLMRQSGLHSIAWFIVRAFRRAFRVAPHAIAFARRLGLADALPTDPLFLPRPNLSERIKRIVHKLGGDAFFALPDRLLDAYFHLLKIACGMPRMWRTAG
jgi:transposase